MPTLRQRIATEFLAELAASKHVDLERIEQLKQLLADSKKPKAEAFVKIFSRADGDLK